MVFLDQKEAYNTVPREILKWEIMRKGVLKPYNNVIQSIEDMYEGACTSVKSTYEQRNKGFQVKNRHAPMFYFKPLPVFYNNRWSYKGEGPNEVP